VATPGSDRGPTSSLAPHKDSVPGGQEGKDRGQAPAPSPLPRPETDQKGLHHKGFRPDTPEPAAQPRPAPSGPRPALSHPAGQGGEGAPGADPCTGAGGERHTPPRNRRRMAEKVQDNENTATMRYKRHPTGRAARPPWQQASVRIDLRADPTWRLTVLLARLLAAPWLNRPYSSGRLSPLSSRSAGRHGRPEGLPVNSLTHLRSGSWGLSISVEERLLGGSPASSSNAPSSWCGGTATWPRNPPDLHSSIRTNAS
jgi:hypothetical protein